MHTWYVYKYYIYIYIHHSDQLTIINPREVVPLISKTHQDLAIFIMEIHGTPLYVPPINLIKGLLTSIIPQ